jgi:hypothetical protein
MRFMQCGVERWQRQTTKKHIAVLVLIGFSLLATVLWIGILFWTALQTVNVIASMIEARPAYEETAAGVSVPAASYATLAARRTHHE